ncbi:hypothetical protein [Denitromonas halophila]|uniref:Uncharacterized protein n=1 Tax=Denitromonas halophila TaxID=1629404 RepID=A0A557QFD5_9RHOO|nr:hypothetical protein [Denitromonas halophila]TVO51603.1 hypothetical protein FHP91_19255 [Denitromonas halophila]
MRNVNRSRTGRVDAANAEDDDGITYFTSPATGVINTAQRAEASAVEQGRCGVVDGAGQAAQRP